VVAPSTSVYGRQKSYNFLHKTLQEFCTAWYISKLTLQDQLKCINRYWDNWQELIWRFFSGITKLPSCEVLNSFSSKEVKYLGLHAKYCGLNSAKYTRSTETLIRCIYEAQNICEKKSVCKEQCVCEAQNDKLCQKVGDHLNGKLKIDIGISFYVATVQAVDYLLEHYKGTVHIGARIIPENDPEMLGKMLQKRLRPHHKVTIILDLNIHNNTHQCLSLISLLMQCTCPIAKLQINLMPLRAISIVQLLSQIITSRNIITVLHITGGVIGVPSEAFQLANFRNLMFHELAIKCCHFNTAKIDGLGEMLHYNPSIVSAEFYHNGIADRGVERLVYHLSKRNKLQHLGLKLNEITAVGANHLTRLIATDCSKLASIELSWNHLKDEGVHTILSSLTVTMEYIGLRAVQITSSSYPIIAAALHKVKAISFDLFEDSEVISEAIAAIITLKSLTLFACNLDLTYKNVLDAICQNKSIERLQFKNFFTIRLISDVVLHSKTLKELFLYSLRATVSGDILSFADSLMV